MSVEWNHEEAIVTLDEYPNMRFKVWNDSDSSDPIKDSGVPIELYVFRSGYESTAQKNTGEWIERFKSLCESFDEDVAIEVLRRYATIFQGWGYERAKAELGIFSKSGHSQGDWAHIFVAVSEEGYGTAESWASEWRQWACGDVYGVQAERFEFCTESNCHGDEESHWTSVSDQGIEFEITWGIYADDVEDAAEHYAKEWL